MTSPTAQPTPPAPPPGAVAGTALRAARLSARLTPAQLGAAISVDEASITAREDGADPRRRSPAPSWSASKSR
ncbi:MAG: hypothetical protein ACRDNZ_16695 [Streptosporangiaceae bacterium]